MSENENKVTAVQVYRLDNLEKKVTEICDKLTDILEKLPERYQTKVMCDNITSCCKDRYMEKIDDIHTEVENVKSKYDRLMWFTISGGALVIWDLVRPILSK